MKLHRHLRRLLLCSIIGGTAVGLGGCGGSADKQGQPAPTVPPATAAPLDENRADADAPGLAELSPADRALAEKQKICPVSGERLGAMGKPVKITVKGQTVFLCCAGCEEAVRKDPDKYLAKLKEKPAK
jgi:YHS domain-containing protein